MIGGLTNDFGRRGLALGLVTLAACTNSGAAQTGARGVSMFRGNATRSGVFPAPSGQALAGLQWRFMTNGDVISSPVPAGDVVYVGSGDGNLYGIDRVTGTKKWSFDAGNAIHSSPAVGGGSVYFGTRDGHFYAVDVATGKQRWKFTTGALTAWAWGHESGDVYTFAEYERMARNGGFARNELLELPPSPQRAIVSTRGS